MKKNINLYLCLVIVFLFIALILYSLDAGKYYVGSPDEVVLKLYSQTYSESGNLYISSQTINSASFLRGTIDLNGKIVPLKFLGYIISLGGLISLIPYFLVYFTAFLAVIGLFFAYKISFELSGDKVKSLLFLGVLILLPFFWYWASTPFIENVSAISFFLIGYYSFLKTFKEEKNLGYFILSGIFFGLSVGFRYDLALAVICFCLPLVVVNFREIKIKNLLISLLFFLFFLAPAFIESKILYGSYFSYGEKIIETSMDMPQRTIDNVFAYFLALVAFAPTFFIFLISLFQKPKNNKKIYFSLLFGLLIYVISFSFIIISQHPLNDSSILHISYTRYFLIFFIFSSIFLIDSIFRLPNRKIRVLFILILMVLFVIPTATLINSRISSIKEGAAISEEISSKTPSGSIIIVKYFDKFIYEKRRAFSFGYFELNKGEIDYSRAFNELEKLKDYDLVLYLNDFDEKTFILAELDNRGYELLEIDKDLGLYRLSKK